MGGRDLAEGLEERAQGGLVHVLVQILDVEIHALRPAVGALRGELVAELLRALQLGLSALDVELARGMPVGQGLVLLALLLGRRNLLVGAHLLAVHLFDGCLGGFGGLEVDEGHLAALCVLADAHRGDGAELAEVLLDLLLGPVARHVLDEDVREIDDVRLLPLVPLLEGGDLHRLLANLHAVHALDGLLGGLLSLVMYEAVAV
mmetsp:Transcript_25506/g.66593  ORF Transcript_25506/g.66593 Transcript_25506/m.66593 type:complete len:204 (-) Transcript_25506:538-1149(-)